MDNFCVSLAGLSTANSLKARPSHTYFGRFLGVGACAFDLIGAIGGVGMRVGVDRLLWTPSLLHKSTSMPDTTCETMASRWATRCIRSWLHGERA